MKCVRLACMLRQQLRIGPECRRERKDQPVKTPGSRLERKDRPVRTPESRLERKDRPVRSPERSPRPEVCPEDRQQGRQGCNVSQGR